jgi:hypothetical protein
MVVFTKLLSFSHDQLQGAMNRVFTSIGGGGKRWQELSICKIRCQRRVGVSAGDLPDSKCVPSKMCAESEARCMAYQKLIFVAVMLCMALQASYSQ